ncbi:MAG TPA: cytochrome c [Candidatus Acidoferrales bacterium]|nr:cytochrome c [Candidatus Acidoferrales bacterium]
MKNRVIRVSTATATILVAMSLTAGLATAQGTAPATFKSKCAACHGADGKGQTPVGKSLGIHDLASTATQKMTDADLEQVITKGKNQMPAYGDSLKAPEIKDLVQYVRAFAKK